MVNSEIRIFRLHNNGGSQGLIHCNLAGKRLISARIRGKFHARRAMDFMTRYGKKGCY